MNQPERASDSPIDPIEDGGYRLIFGFYFVAFAAAIVFGLLSLLASFWK